MLVAVGSLNPVKAAASRAAFTLAFGASSVEVSAVAPPPMKEQPTSIAEVVEGSRYRSRWACGRVPGAEYCVGLESGLEGLEGCWYVLTVATVVDGRRGLESIGFGPAFMLPDRISRAVIDEGVEMEEAMHRLYGIEGLGESVGAIGLLSGGLADRLELCVEAVKMALIPVISRDYRD